MADETPALRLFAALLEKFGDQAGPACLVACAQSRTVVSMKVFVEQNVIAKMLVRLELFRVAEHRSAPAVILQENMR